MTVTSLVFVGFVFLTMLLYFVLPKKMQWMVLLAASLFFYAATCAQGLPFLLTTAATVYAAARGMDALTQKRKAYLREHKNELSKDEKKAFKEKINRNRKRILIAAVAFNVGVLCFFKYSHFAAEQLDSALRLFGAAGIDTGFSLIAVVGISFYTFTSVGYLADVYWELVDAQKNFAKMLLFISFFPQIMQGPISEYGQLSETLFAEHDFSYERFSRGFQRMVWGFFKKVVIADYLAALVNDAFDNFSSYTGTACLIAAFCYSIQIYADFSGYMDIMCGVCEMCGVTLAENFERPYFSKSVAEYWRRWHITLGAWFKKYVYYPIGVSRWNRALGKKCARLGKIVSENLPATLALVAVWLLTGLWHGASWAYIAWGGVNGLFIIFSMWMEPVYKKVNHTLRVGRAGFLWRAFRVARTFALNTLIKVLPEVGTLSQGVGFIGRMFTDFTVTTNFKLLFPYIKRAERPYFFAVMLCVALLFVVSVIQRKRSVRSLTAKIPFILRAAVLAVFCFAIVLFSLKTSGANNAFLYVGF